MPEAYVAPGLRTTARRAGIGAYDDCALADRRAKLWVAPCVVQRSDVEYAMGEGRGVGLADGFVVGGAIVGVTMGEGDV